MRLIVLCGFVMSVMWANSIDSNIAKCVEKDFDACEIVLKSGKYSVEACDKNLCNALGIYLRDTSTTKDKKALSLAYLQKSLALKNVLAYRDLGIYYRDIGDLDKAKHYYKLGCEKRVYWACYSLGLIYDSREQDYVNALKYYSIACKSGKAHAKSFACANMGNLYMEDKMGKNGSKIAQDLPKAITYNSIACELEDTIGCANLAQIYEKGGTQVAPNKALAKSYYQKICDIGDSRAIEVANACEKLQNFK